MIYNSVNKDIVAECQRILRAYDPHLEEHCSNTAVYISYLARELGENEHQLKIAACIHDIGKVFYNPAILKKKGPLTMTERTLIDMHSYLGYQELKILGMEEEICQIVLFHHGTDKERMGLFQNPNKTIVWKADILRCCDIFEALTEDRPYRNGMSLEDSLYILERSNIPKKILEAMEKSVIPLCYSERKRKEGL